MPAQKQSASPSNMNSQRLGQSWLREMLSAALPGPSLRDEMPHGLLMSRFRYRINLSQRFYGCTMSNDREIGFFSIGQFRRFWSGEKVVVDDGRMRLLRQKDGRTNTRCWTKQEMIRGPIDVLQTLLPCPRPQQHQPETFTASSSRGARGQNKG